MWSWVPQRLAGTRIRCVENLLASVGKNDVADLRDVDDTISLTRVYCRDCIVIRATMIYPPRIVFEPQPLSGTTSTWLDIDVHLSRTRGLVPTRRELTCGKWREQCLSEACCSPFYRSSGPGRDSSTHPVSRTDHPLDAVSPISQPTSGCSTPRTTSVAPSRLSLEDPSGLVVASTQ